VPIRPTSATILNITDLSTRQAAVFVVESVFNYCPEHTSLLP
jgi:hypothetical protein